MAAYTYPDDFNSTLWSILDGNLYISPQGSDSSGNGSPASPYRSIQHACDMAFEGEKLVIGPGIYQEAIDGLQKALHIAGQGQVILDGASLPGTTAFSNIGQGFQAGITGITIRNYTNAIDGPVRKVLHCKITDSNITDYGGLLEYCLLKNSSIQATGLTDIVNCTLVNTQCGSTAIAADAFRIIANTYIDSLSHIELNAALVRTWDYCYVAPGAVLQIDGIVFANPLLLNAAFPTWLINHAEGDPEFQDPEADDYTLQPGSSLLHTGMHNHFIGAFGQSLRLAADALENTQLTNIELNGDGFFEIVDEADFSGTITTAELDLGKLTIMGIVGVFSDQDVSDPLNGRVDYDNTMRASNLCTYKMRFSKVPNDLETKEFQEFVWHEPPMIDKNGRGNGDPAFQRSNAAMLVTRYIQIKATIQTAQAFGLLMESNDFLLQEDGDLLLL